MTISASCFKAARSGAARVLFDVVLGILGTRNKFKH